MPASLKSFAAALLTTAIVGVGLVTPVGAASAAPGQTTDLQVTVDAPTSAIGGAPFSITIDVDNNGPSEAAGSGVTYTFPAGAAIASTSCSATGGATCPTLTTGPTQIAGTIPALPFSGNVTITVTGTFSATGPTSVTSTGVVTVASGMTESNPATNTSVVNTAMSYPLDLSASKILTPSTIAPNVPVTIATTFTNAGPSSGDGSEISDGLQASGTARSLYGAWTATLVGCTVTGGAVCPTDLPVSLSGAFNSSAYPSLYSRTVPSMPAGSSLTITYSFVAQTADPLYCGSERTGSIASAASISAAYPGPSETNYFNNSAFAYLATGPLEPCPELDLAVDKSQSGTPSLPLSPGASVDYTLTFTNKGPGNGAGAILNDFVTLSSSAIPSYGSATITNFSCTVTGGAVCPADVPSPDPQSTDYGQIRVLNGAVPEWPVGGTIVLTYTITYDARTSGVTCGSGAGTITNTALVTLPAGYVDPVPADNQDGTSQITPTLEQCVAVNLVATKSTPATTVVAGQPIPFSVTFTNEGPNDVTGAEITDTLGFSVPGTLFLFGHATIASTTCTPTGAAVCPTFTGSSFQIDSFERELLRASVDLAVGDSLTFTYTATLDLRATPQCYPSGQVTNAAAIDAPAQYFETNEFDNRAQVAVPTACSDITIIKAVTPTTATVGEPVTYTIDVTNSSGGPADSVLVQDPLPLFFTLGSATCEATVGASACGTVEYDETTRTISSTIPNLAVGDTVRITLTGTAGQTPGTYGNTATVGPTLGVSRFIDPFPDTNVSQVNVRIAPMPVLRAQKTGPISAQVGSVVAWQVTGYSEGGADVPTPYVVDGPFPAGIEHVTVSAEGALRPLSPTVYEQFVGGEWIALATYDGVTDLSVELDAAATAVRATPLSGSVAAGTPADPTVFGQNFLSATVSDTAPATLENCASATAAFENLQSAEVCVTTAVTPVVTTYAVGDFVWLDTDGDGIQGATEEGVANVTVTLLDAAGAVVASTATDSRGHYVFDGLAAGDYQIEFSDIDPKLVTTLEASGADQARADDSNVEAGRSVTAVTPIFSLGVLVRGTTAVEPTDSSISASFINRTIDMGLRLASVTSPETPVVPPPALPADPSSPTGLASTGIAVGSMVAGAVALLLAGIILMASRRRARQKA